MRLCDPNEQRRVPSAFGDRLKVKTCIVLSRSASLHHLVSFFDGPVRLQVARGMQVPFLCGPQRSLRVVALLSLACLCYVYLWSERLMQMETKSENNNKSDSVSAVVQADIAIIGAGLAGNERNCVVVGFRWMLC